jgi:inhibitor of cysteine peptidase
MRRGIAFVLFGVMVVSCGGDDAQRQVIEQRDSGSEVSVEVGDEFEVRLESNPTTGYGWVVAAQPDVVDLLTSDFEAPDTELVGAGGVEVLVFEAMAPGSGELRLEYVRSFDDPPVPAEAVEYQLQVTEP